MDKDDLIVDGVRIPKNL